MASLSGSKAAAVDPCGRGMGEVHGRHELGVRSKRVDVAGQEADLVAHPDEDLLPLGDLVRHAVDPGQPR